MKGHHSVAAVNHWWSRSITSEVCRAATMAKVREHQNSGAPGRSKARTRPPLLRFARAPVQEDGLADEEGEQVERGARHVRRRLEPCRVPRERANVRSQQQHRRRVEEE
eukprot:6202636-Pleurochrysis_carterae.AAC.1